VLCPNARLRCAIVLALATHLVSGCGGSTTTSDGVSSTSTSAGTTTGAGGVGHGAGGAAGSQTTGATGGFGGFGGWGSGGGCPAAAQASPFGDPAGACGACMADHCGAVIAVCFGPGWASGHYAGSCEDFQRCLCTCLAGGKSSSDCFSQCAPRISADCNECSPVIAKCQAASCQAECAAQGG
jgi:hypothetical protein